MTHTKTAHGLERLRDPASPLRAELTALFVDGFLDAPLSTWIEPEGLAALITDAIAEPEAGRILREHVRPAVDRYRARASKVGETVGDVLPPDASARIDALLAGVRRVDLPWAHGIVDAERVRDLVAPVVQETLVRFAKKLPIPGLSATDEPSGSSGLAGRVRRGLGESASRIADVGRSVGKSVIGGFDKKLQAVAHDFSQSAMREVREAMRARLASDEGRALTAAIREHALEKLRTVPTSEIIALLDAVPREELEGLVLEAVLHNARRSLVHQTVREEIEAVLAAEGKQPIRAVLERAGIHEAVRGFLVGRGEVLLGIVAADERFAGLLGRLFDD